MQPKAVLILCGFCKETNSIVKEIVFEYWDWLVVEVNVDVALGGVECYDVCVILVFLVMKNGEVVE